MSTISVELLSQEPDLNRFSCGVSAVDEMVSAAYFKHILLKKRVYKISFKEHEIGYYQLSFDRISLDGSDVTYTDYDSDNWYGVLCIDYIAIKKEFQRKGIGSIILGRILKQAKELSKEWPIRLVKIDSLCDRTEWYLKNGFEYLHEDNLDKEYGTIEMFFDLMTVNDRKRVDAFCEEKLE